MTVCVFRRGRGRATAPGASRAPFAAAAVTAFALLAPSAAPAERALVLSGGGARGLAHAGALVGLTRKGYDPDLVLGTSMGSIIGALYASGIEPDSVWRIMAEEDWREMFTPFPLAVGPARSIRYPALRLQGSVREGLLVRGYVPDWEINRKLVRYLFRAGARVRGNFDLLPRRYRSVTADLETGAMVSIGFGDLPRAVRASMAAPGFFSPIRWRDRILVDGGIRDYMPVDEARRLGADFVIAVDAQRPPAKIHSVDALAVARRSIELMLMRARTESQPPEILILPDLEPAQSPITYPVDPTPLLEAGLTAALREVDQADGPGAPKSREIAEEPRSLGAVHVEMGGSPLGAFVRRSCRGAVGAYDPERILDIVDRLYATGLFEGVWPSVEESVRAETPALRVRAETQGPVSLAGAVGYDNDRGGRIWSSLRALDALGGSPVEVGLEGSVNGVDQWAAAMLRIASLSRPASSWTAGASWGESEVRFLDTDADPGNPEVVRAGGWMGLEWRGLDPDLEAALVGRAEKIKADVGPEGASYGTLLRVGTVPGHVEAIGTTRALEGEMRFGEARYGRVRAKASLHSSIGPVAFALLADGEATSKKAPLDALPAMGNDYLVPALRWGERRGRARAVLGLDGSAPMPFKGTLRLRLRGGVVADELRPDGTVTRDATWLGGVGVTGLWWTVFGRVEGGLEAETLGNRRAVITLGQDF